MQLLSYNLVRDSERWLNKMFSFIDSNFELIWSGFLFLIIAIFVIGLITGVIRRIKYNNEKSSFKNDDFWKN